MLEEVLSWTRSLPGSQRLKALVVFDEVYRYLPPHPANPTTKRRSCVGRLQTDADRARMVEGLPGARVHGGQSATQLTNTIKRLSPRWFLMRNAHAAESTVFLQPRWAMSFMRGPMTRMEIRRALAERRAPPHGIGHSSTAAAGPDEFNLHQPSQ